MRVDPQNTFWNSHLYKIRLTPTSIKTRSAQLSPFAAQWPSPAMELVGLPDGFAVAVVFGLSPSLASFVGVGVAVAVVLLARHWLSRGGVPPTPTPPPTPAPPPVPPTPTPAPPEDMEDLPPRSPRWIVVDEPAPNPSPSPSPTSSPTPAAPAPTSRPPPTHVRCHVCEWVGTVRRQCPECGGAGAMSPSDPPMAGMAPARGDGVGAGAGIIGAEPPTPQQRRTPCPPPPRASSARCRFLALDGGKMHMWPGCAARVSNVTQTTQRCP